MCLFWLSSTAPLCSLCSPSSLLSSSPSFSPSTSSSRMWWTNSLCNPANEDLGSFAEYDPLTHGRCERKKCWLWQYTRAARRKPHHGCLYQPSSHTIRLRLGRWVCGCRRNFAVGKQRCPTPRDYDTELKSTESSIKYQTYELPDGNTITSDQVCTSQVFFLHANWSCWTLHLDHVQWVFCGAATVVIVVYSCSHSSLDICCFVDVAPRLGHRE